MSPPITLTQRIHCCFLIFLLFLLTLNHANGVWKCPLNSDPYRTDDASVRHFDHKALTFDFFQVPLINVQEYPSLLGKMDITAVRQYAWG